MKKISYLAPLLLMVLLAWPLAAEENLTFNPTVYTPNGVKYTFHFETEAITKNTTDNKTISQHKMILDGYIELNSKLLQYGWQAWGLTFLYNSEEYLNNTLEKIQSFNISIPPVLAIKEGTRQVYPTTILIKLVEGEYDSPDQAIADLGNNKPVEDFFVYNPFYIQTNVEKGDRIPYGLYNNTSGEAYIIYGEIIGETSLSIAGDSYNVWIVDLTSDIMELIGGLIEEEEDIQDINATLTLLYEKTTSWLLKLGVNGFEEVTDDQENTTETYTLNGYLQISDLGSINVGGKTYLERIVNLPSYSGIAISALGIIGAVLLVVQRLKK